MSTLLIVLFVFLGSYLATAGFLRLGARWMGIPRVSFPRALFATLLIGLLSILVHLLFHWRFSTIAVPPLVGLGIETCVDLLLTWLTIKSVFRTSVWRAIGSWLPTLIPSIAIIVLIYLVMVPYVLAAFIVPTHTMAPTLLGPHQKGVCPHCGQVATLYFNPEHTPPGEIGKLGMCESCQQAGIVIDVAPKVFEADRFLVNKLLTPKRWDLVVFRALENPSIHYVKRLVGLPGEEVVIKDGKIWINGAQQESPAEIAKLTFDADPTITIEGWGSPERPMKLGNDEFFVVGDFGQRSADSRTWGAIPGKNIEGVATLIYWPLSRWRLIK